MLLLLLHPIKSGSNWCIRQVVCGFLALGALRQGLVLLGSTAMTLRVRALGDDEADELARMARSVPALFDERRSCGTRWRKA